MISAIFIVVGVAGVEPTASWTRTLNKCRKLKGYTAFDIKIDIKCGLL